MPQICEVWVKPRTPEYVMNLAEDNVALSWRLNFDGDVPPAWTKETRDGVCWYLYQVPLTQVCCEWRCNDAAVVPITLDGEPLECERTYSFECEGENGPVMITRKETVTLDGDVRVCRIELVAECSALLEIEFNCSTGVGRGRVSDFEFIYRQDFTARYVGTEEIVEEDVSGSDPACPPGGSTVSYNKDPMIYGCGSAGSPCFNGLDCSGEEPGEGNESCCEDFVSTGNIEFGDTICNTIAPFVPYRDYVQAVGDGFCWKFRSGWHCTPCNYRYGTANFITQIPPTPWVEFTFGINQVVHFTPKFAATDSNRVFGCPSSYNPPFDRMTMPHGGSTFETLRWEWLTVWGDNDTPLYRCETDLSEEGDNLRSPPWVEDCTASMKPPGLQIETHAEDDPFTIIDFEFDFLATIEPAAPCEAIVNPYCGEVGNPNPGPV
jgi:hypothetical protein